MRPAHLEAFVHHALSLLARDPRLLGVGAAGSWISGRMDDYSDLDLWIAVAPEHEASVSAERAAIAGSLGPLIACFTGEHVGESRLLICFYDTTPPAHVDLKFVAVGELAERVEDPVVLWERDGAMSRAMAGSSAHYPGVDPQWIEDRFWIWVHYVAAKIGRGELFEALDGLALLRGRVLGPLVLAAHGCRPSGVRRVESRAPEHVTELRATIGAHDAAACAAALDAAVHMYRRLRDAAGAPLVRRVEAERAAVAYADGVARQVG